jgi:O-antigen ligase
VRILIGAGALAAVYGLVQTVINGTTFRVQGTMGHYMTFSGLLLLIGLLAIAQLLFHHEKGRDAWLIGALVLILGALLMTQTRSAWLGLAVGCIPLVWCWRKRFLFALPILGLLVVLLSPQPVKERVRSYFDPQDLSMLTRLYLWNSGWRIFREYPLTGVGPDNLRDVYEVYKDARDPRPRFMHLHSNIVQLAAERGIVGVSAWLWIWVAYFRSVGRIYRQSSSRDGPSRALILGSIAAIQGFLVAGLFECNYRDSEVASLTYFIMALPFCSQRPIETAGKPAPAPTPTARLERVAF